MLVGCSLKISWNKSEINCIVAGRLQLACACLDMHAAHMKLNSSVVIRVMGMIYPRVLNTVWKVSKK
jgi:hypothetical protein